jgi:hypothetical protein
LFLLYFFVVLTVFTTLRATCMKVTGSTLSYSSSPILFLLFVFIDKSNDVTLYNNLYCKGNYYISFLTWSFTSLLFFVPISPDHGCHPSSELAYFIDYLVQEMHSEMQCTLLLAALLFYSMPWSIWTATIKCHRLDGLTNTYFFSQPGIMEL